MSTLAPDVEARIRDMARRAERVRAWRRVRAAARARLRPVLRNPPVRPPECPRRIALPPLRAVVEHHTWRSLPYLRREGGEAWAVRPPAPAGRLRPRWWGQRRQVIVTTWRYRTGAAVTAAWPDERPDATVLTRCNHVTAYRGGDRRRHHGGRACLGRATSASAPATGTEQR